MVLGTSTKTKKLIRNDQLIVQSILMKIENFLGCTKIALQRGPHVTRGWKDLSYRVCVLCNPFYGKFSEDTYQCRP